MYNLYNSVRRRLSKLYNFFHYEGYQKTSADEIVKIMQNTSDIPKEKLPLEFAKKVHAILHSSESNNIESKFSFTKFS